MLEKLVSEKYEIDLRWWALILAYVTSDEFEKENEKLTQRAEEQKRFERESDDCPYLVVEQFGNAYEHICHHPSRYDPLEWCMCEMGQCPLTGEKTVKFSCPCV